MQVRPKHRRAAWLAGLAAAALAVGGWAADDGAAPPSAESASDPSLGEGLALQWSARRAEIVTADVHYRQIFGRQVTSNLSPADVAAIVARYDLAADRERARDLAVELQGGPLKKDPPWAESRFVLEGSSLRYEQGNFVQVRHGDLELIYDGDNDQADVYPRGQSQRMFAEPSHFRPIPPSDNVAELFEFSAADGAAVRVVSRAGDAEALYDRATGLPLHLRSVVPGSGEVLTDLWLQGIVQYPGDVPFPTAVVQARYQAGRLANYWIRIVDQADFNAPVPSDTFELPLGAGGVVIDRRGPEKSAHRQESATVNLASSLPSPDSPAAGGDAAPPEASSRMPWIWAFNGLLLIAVGVFLWRWDRRRVVRNAEKD